jgi:NADH:ubiquinone oxidoreductase subunit 2 (subunit N)
VFVILTPFTFVFLIFYGIFLFTLLYSPDFYFYWIVIECSSLIFIGVCYSFISFGFSSIMLYFIIQALCSVNIFVFYSLSFERILLVFLFLKLAVFPFFGWFPMVAIKLTNPVFLIISTFQKLPSLLLFYGFLSSYSSSFFIVCLSCTILSSSLFIFSTCNLRLLLAFSSVGSNAWLLLSCLCGLDFLFLFFTTYSFIIFVLFWMVGSSLKINSSYSLFYTLVILILLLSISGFPPFPPFFMKLYILYHMTYSSMFMLWSMQFVLISSVYALSSYIRFSIHHLVNIFCNTFSLLI